MLGILNELNIGYLVDEDGNDKAVDLGKLSGGEKKRIAIARGLYQDSGILIFDEPTAGLDPPQAKVINEIIFNLDDKLRIIITHNWDKDYLSSFDQVIDIERE